MDFSANTDFGFVLAEFRAKYNDSYILVDGKPSFVLSVTMDGIDFHRIGFIEYGVITTLANLNLKPGLYLTNKKTTLVYIAKRPERQWCKGVKFGVTHTFKILAGAAEETTIDIDYIGIYTIFNDLVFIYDKAVGSLGIGDGTITLANRYKHLKAEAEELWPQYRII